MDEEQRRRFAEALERKRREADLRSRQGIPHTTPPRVAGMPPVEEPQINAANTPQGVVDPRVKSAGHRQKTADKWNQ